MTPPTQPPRRYSRYGVLLIIVGLLAGLGIAEWSLRRGMWRPPLQIVRGFGLHGVDGVPVWETASDRHNRACVEQHPERTRILFFGSSITFGTDLKAEEAFTAGLQTRLNELRPTPGFCVLNFAQPGFSFEQKYAVARAEVQRYKPALIMWENWVEWAGYRMMGDAAYGIGDLRVRDDGFVGLSGVSDSVNRFLFLHSYLYQYLVLTFGERVVDPPGPRTHGVTLFANEHLSKVVRLADAAGVKLVMYPSPPLDKPFSETAAELPDWHARILEFTQTNGIPTYPLQRELVDRDYLELRFDPCCHFNAAGHRALVPIMTRIVLEQLDGAKPSL